MLKVGNNKIIIFFYKSRNLVPCRELHSCSCKGLQPLVATKGCSQKGPLSPKLILPDRRTDRSQESTNTNRQNVDIKYCPFSFYYSLKMENYTFILRVIHNFVFFRSLGLKQKFLPNKLNKP